MYEINGTKIKLTKGDTFETIVGIKQGEEDYTPVEGDSVRFALKQNYEDKDPLINKSIPIDTLLLRLESSDTKTLEPGKYVYDIEITKASGDVDTFISDVLTLTPEVH